MTFWNQIVPITASSTLSAIAVITSALVVDPGIPIAGARLDHLEPVLHEFGVHVVNEPGAWLPTVHHSRQAVRALAFAAGTFARGQVADIRLLWKAGV